MSSPAGPPVGTEGRRGGHRGSTYAAVATTVLLLVGVVLVVLGVRGSPGPPAPAALVALPATATSTPASSTTGGRPPAGQARATASATSVPQPSFGRFFGASQPVRLDVSSIDLHATSFVGLQIGADGSLTPPPTEKLVGLYAAGPTPGQLGPAVFGAHVDSKEEPGVFYRLGGTKVGDRIVVTRADGIVLTYTVDKVGVFLKDQFPTDEVYYGDSTQSQIRLVTCGGTFDKVKHYLDNVVVFGRLTSAT